MNLFKVMQLVNVSKMEVNGLLKGSEFFRDMF